MHRIEALEGFAPVLSLIREGRFKDALVVLSPLGSPRKIGERTIYHLLRAELSVELGDLRSALAACTEIKTADDAHISARRHRALARTYFALGEFARGNSELASARAAARTSGDAVVQATVGLTELTFSSARKPYEATSSELADLKRLIANTGDAHLMIELRLAVARTEARFNSLQEATKHISVARDLLARYPNRWLDGFIDLDSSILYSLKGDLTAALRYVRAAAEHAHVSGHFRTRIAALINSAHLLVSQGDFATARTQLDAVSKEAHEYPQLVLAAHDARANLLITRGDYKQAAVALEEATTLACKLEGGRLHWDAMTEAYSRARLALGTAKWQEAVRELGTAEDIAERCGDKVWLARIRLLKVKGLALAGEPSAARQLPAHVDQAFSLELVAQWNGAVAGGYARNSAGSAVHLGRALRIARGLGNNDLIHDVAAGFVIGSDGGASAGPTNTLDSAVALIDVASHPHILAREALALIEVTGCATDVALIARGERTVRALEVRGWTEREALQAARTAGTETIDCGTLGDEALQIVARPLEELEPRCTWLAIRKLVATGLTVERYRRDEKQRAALWPTESLEGDPDCLWISPAVIEVVRVAKRIGPTPLSVLLTGETGTGKEMLARTIHQASDRADKTLLAFNCTAVPRDMLESQLFGYRKGAFTGADSAFTGIIRAAEGGTLFLDEIADMPLDIQPKLLRFLESHEVHPLGESQPVKVDVRVIAATNANLEQQVEDGTFRQDLFYRLNVVRLRLPPLRERREEVPALVEHYVNRYAAQQKKGRLTLTDEALEYLLLYPWPGNLRQLANEVNRMVAMAEPDSALTVTHLSPEIQATRKTIPATAAPDSELRISLNQSLPEAVELLERTMVQSALDRSKGRLEDAARLLGISRKGLFLKRRRWGIGSDS